ncbi:hydroxyacid dehydrogenase [Fusobacterium necrophorum subsp. funduliforme]|uniref:2-hydroxyacid dehydrogenase n=2 Tax=Fusobacterium necrophorum TaxID=859 RepID=A0AB73BUH2_9FUSO|nr:NAD(P)-dependent oxidoreductase [Fusobacterium necrophorum]AYZ72891.1 hydroxyacid dehydrogenase [Fusobacterium necrophorum]AZW09109.1 hydroxyacid dehydrogenase [Fusobacterium necrophorum subsp. necrophorum]EYD69706.1 D-isomer specific 2-hydroxyacid dehydrogenase NAD-binding protein [Fusobacterium necrophorum subsp. funduliforme B35]KDE62063.1 2-hydroxyacid dehydrogenase [Fusobacterium necrophorum BL]KDE62301.1 2-hydroxyacid dehydrogenase [Fusobacterium necrophorum BFTR-1]
MEYDVIHFEALGEEAKYLEQETRECKKKGLLPANFKYLITPENVQTYLLYHKHFILPDLITTKTHSILPEEYLVGKKKSVVTRSAGYDHFEHLQSIINLASLREYCVNAVAQTAIKFLYAACGRMNEYMKNTASFERNHTTSFMELGKNRIATVFGVGKIGKKIYELLEQNDLTVQAVDIREQELKRVYGDSVKFVSKEEALLTSDILINAMNLTKNPKSKFYNMNYFSEKEFSLVKKGVIFINVTRGEIAPESILLNCYKKGIISGIGLDVFTNEEVFSKVVKGEMKTQEKDIKAAKKIEEKALSQEENFYVQPHQAFNSDLAARAKAKEAMKQICIWYKNNKEKFDEQLPYYCD